MSAGVGPNIIKDSRIVGLTQAINKEALDNAAGLCPIQEG